MPSWGNTDANTAKPHFPDMRQVRLAATTTVANIAVAGNTVITVTSATGIAVGQFVYGGGPGVISATGQRDFFKGNNTVQSINGTNIVLTNAVTANVNAATQITFDAAIQYNTANTVANTFADTILVTAGRTANTQGTTYGGGSTVANTKLGSVNQGWNRIQRKILPDGTIRFLKETLICLANAVASNTSSANTSANAIFGGL
jgi:hypothetical protein